MAITHSLMLATDKTEDKLKILLSKEFDLADEAENYLKGAGVYISVSSIKGLRQEVVLEDYSVLATQCIYFDLSTKDDAEEGLNTIGKIVANLLRKEEGDFVLLLCGDAPVLHRLEGHITFDRSWDANWLAQSLDDLGIVYEQQGILSLTRDI